MNRAITEEDWTAFSKAIATDKNPLLHSPAAMERYMTYAKPYITEVRSPVGKFKSHNSCELVDFLTPEDRAYYEEAEIRLAEKQNKLEQEAAEHNETPSRFQLLAILGEFCKSAEVCKSGVFASKIHEAVQNGKAPGVACRYRQPVAKTIRMLVKDYGYSRDDISVIWGGDELQNCKLTLEDAQRLAQKIADGEEISPTQKKQILLLLTETEAEREERLHDYGGDLRLGSQSREERQKEIDRFQTGKSIIALFTFAAGGTGLSLHHTDIDTKGRAVNLRPRQGFLTPTYSAQDFVQGLGRLHRSIFSLSDTEQRILFFKGTVEEDVMARVSLKLRCFKKVVSSREQWDSAIWERGKPKGELEKELNAELEKNRDNLDEEYNDDDIAGYEENED